MLQEILVPLAPVAPILLRLAVGLTLIMHGWPKLGSGRTQTKEFMKGTGMPTSLALLAGVAEFFGGLAILIGLLTPIASILAALWLLGTTIFAKAKLKKNFIGGYELDIALLAGALVLAIIGPGQFSVDAFLGL